MDNTYMELVKVFVALLGAVVTYYVIPYIKAKTTKEQREDAVFWTKLAVQIAEEIYKEKGVTSPEEAFAFRKSLKFKNNSHIENERVAMVI